MRDQDIDLACIVDDEGGLRPMRLRYGITEREAAHHEPLDLAVNQEEPELSVDDDGTWDDVEPDVPAVLRTHVWQATEDLDEEQVAMAAEQDAMHVVGSVAGG